MTFGQRLKKEREAQGLTQADLAKEINVSIPTIAEYEADKKMPRHNKLIALSKRLGTSVDYLLGLTDIKEPADVIKQQQVQPQITDLLEYTMKKSPTNHGKPISESKAKEWNLVFEKLFELMKKDLVGEDADPDG